MIKSCERAKPYRREGGGRPREREDENSKFVIFCNYYGGSKMSNLAAKDVAKMIDHSLLNPAMTEEDIVEGCGVARKYDVASVCVKPSFLGATKKALEGSDVLLTTVIGFPHGSNATEVKVFEAEAALAIGCQELDMVLDVGKLLGGDYGYVERDIAAVAEVTHKAGAVLKVILENAYLTNELIVKACEISESVGADFVKTSTGYASSGATVPDLRLMRASVSAKVRVKAAGGIRTLDAALAARAAGAVRVGATSTAKIMEEAIAREAAGTLCEPEDTDAGGIANEGY